MAERTSVRLVRSVHDEAEPVQLDESQRRAVEHRGGPLLLLAGPGTGKTTTLVEAVVDRIEHAGVDPEQVLVLTFSRQAASELRERIARRLRRTVREPLARTFHSYAFGLLRREAVQQGLPAPRLLGSAEQDVLVRELLQGDVEQYGARYWPERFRAALRTRGFAEHLRELMMRAVERGVSAEQIAELARAHGRDDWAAAARFAQQYGAVTAFRRPPSYDQAELVRAAAALLRDDPALLARERQARAFVVVDEYQDCDPAQEELLALLSGGGGDLLVVGDHDQSIYGFRGAEPEGIRRFPERFRTAAGEPATVLALKVSRRCGPVLLAASRRVAARLGGPWAHRELVAAEPNGAPDPFTAGPSAGDEVSVHVLSSAGQQAAFVASRLRAAHLLDEVPWSSMAVLVRAASAIPLMRRALAAAGVPVNVRPEEVPLIDQAPVRALLALLELAVGDRVLDAELAYELVTGPLGGADALAMRRLRHGLRRDELVAGGSRDSGQLLVEALNDPAVLETLDVAAVEPAVRVAAMLAAGRDAAARDDVTAEGVLWAIWSSSDLGPRWSQAALSGGRAAPQADADLDAVCALFESAARYVDRMPGAKAGGFAPLLRDQQLPGGASQSQSQARRSAPGVTISTAHGSKGLEWDVVAVVDVNEGIWPDFRERGGLLDTEALVDVVARRDGSAVTRASARLAEERRLFYVAVSRAKRQLYVTAVSDDDTAPSRFLDDLDPPQGSGVPGEPPSAGRPMQEPERAMSLPAVVAELRRVVCDPVEDVERRHGAAYQLARLAAAGVRQADPDEWYGLRPLSVDKPLELTGPVRVSPSKVEEFNRCELRWLLKVCGATSADTGRVAIGSLVHALAERAAAEGWGDDKLLTELDNAWPRVDAGEGWVEAREYRRVRDMVVRLGRWLRANPRTFLGAELEFDVSIGQARLVGRVDRLDADNDGGLVVVDYKTGVSAPTAGELSQHAQLATYQLAVEHGAFDAVSGGVHRSGGASLVQLGKPFKGDAREQVQPPLADGDPPRWAHEMLERTAAGMRSPAVQASKGPWCGFCPARPSCPAVPDGQQVTP